VIGSESRSEAGDRRFSFGNTPALLVTRKARLQTQSSWAGEAMHAAEQVDLDFLDLANTRRGRWFHRPAARPVEKRPLEIIRIELPYGMDI
jgi:hypothetical protein